MGPLEVTEAQRERWGSGAGGVWPERETEMKRQREQEGERKKHCVVQSNLLNFFIIFC